MAVIKQERRESHTSAPRAMDFIRLTSKIFVAGETAADSNPITGALPLPRRHSNKS